MPVTEPERRIERNGGEPVPPQRWVSHPVSDAADYLDREPPSYLDDDDSRGLEQHVGIPQPILTKDLLAPNVPSVRPDQLYGNDHQAQPQPLWTFALTFDGYKYFGGDEDAGERLGSFARSVERSYLGTGQLPRVGEIGMLRACLFFEQRQWCKWGKVDMQMERKDALYLAALTDAIRERLR